MSDRVSKFCATLQTKLNALDDRMQSLKAGLKSAPKQAEDALHKQLDHARQKVESQQQAVGKAKTSLKEWADQKKTEAKATIEQWKTNHEAKKLAHRADRAEEYAIAAVVIATASVEEAEQAVLEAIVARLDADVVPVG